MQVECGFATDDGRPVWVCRNLCPRASVSTSSCHVSKLKKFEHLLKKDDSIVKPVGLDFWLVLYINVIGINKELMCAPLNTYHWLFPWTLVMAYSKINLETNGGKASAFVRPFWIGNARDKHLPVQNLLYFSFKQALMTITNSTGTPNSTIMFHNAVVLSESQVYLSCVNSWWAVHLTSKFFIGIWRVQNIWSVVDRLRRNPRWWSPII